MWVWCWATAITIICSGMQNKAQGRGVLGRGGTPSEEIGVREPVDIRDPRFEVEPPHVLQVSWVVGSPSGCHLFNLAFRSQPGDKLKRFEVILVISRCRCSSGSRHGS
jgi:hypothetical protein